MSIDPDWWHDSELGQAAREIIDTGFGSVRSKLEDVEAAVREGNAPESPDFEDTVKAIVAAALRGSALQRGALPFKSDAQVKLFIRQCADVARQLHLELAGRDIVNGAGEHVAHVMVTDDGLIMSDCGETRRSWPAILKAIAERAGVPAVDFAPDEEGAA